MSDRTAAFNEMCERLDMNFEKLAEAMGRPLAEVESWAMNGVDGADPPKQILSVLRSLLRSRAMDDLRAAGCDVDVTGTDGWTDIVATYKDDDLPPWDENEGGDGDNAAGSPGSATRNPLQPLGQCGSPHYRSGLGQPSCHSGDACP
jgi:hypothetical protein